MSRRWLFVVAACLLGLALGLGLGTAVGQQAPPTDTKGISVAKTTAVDLGPEIEGMQGRQLRLRLISLEPGGHVAVHSHEGRPGVVYVLQGTFMEHRGSGANQYRAGDTFWENKDTTHWVENKGTKQAWIVAVDIFKQP